MRHRFVAVVGIAVIQGSRRADRLFPQQGEGVIGGDSQQPRAKLRLPAKLAQVLDHAEKRLLSDFFGILMARDDSAAEIVYLLLILQQQRLQGREVACWA